MSQVQHDSSPSAAAARGIDAAVAAWSDYFLAHGSEWEQLVAGTAPRASGCGDIYELANPIDRPGESVAIADMRQLPFAEPHYHVNDETEIYFVLQGTGTVMVGDHVQEVGPHDVVVTPPGRAHATIPHDQLVLGVVNSPPFDPSNVVTVHDDDPSSGFDAARFAQLSSRAPDRAVARELEALAADLAVWATVLLVPNQRGTVLACRARHGLPDDWAAWTNPLDSASMNARVLLEHREIVEHDLTIDRPPTDRPVTRHLIAAAAAVPVPGVGTLEALADSVGYTFSEPRLDRLRAAAKTIATILLV